MKCVECEQKITDTYYEFKYNDEYYIVCEECAYDFVDYNLVDKAIEMYKEEHKQQKEDYTDFLFEQHRENMIYNIRKETNELSKKVLKEVS